MGRWIRRTPARETPEHCPRGTVGSPGATSSAAPAPSGGRPAPGPPTPGHSAAFEGRAIDLAAWLDATDRRDWTLLDERGQSVLHLAVLGGERSRDCVRLLAARGFPCIGAPSPAGWTAWDEAIAQRDRAACVALLRLSLEEAGSTFQRLYPGVLAKLTNMPDFSLKLSWKLTSPVLGPLLRRYAPSDTYTIHKAGARLSISGELRGPDPTSPTILPRWVRGPFTFLVLGDVTPATILLVDHVQRFVMPAAQHVGDATPSEEDISRDVEQVRETRVGSASSHWRPSSPQTNPPPPVPFPSNCRCSSTAIRECAFRPATRSSGR